MDLYEDGMAGNNEGDQGDSPLGEFPNLSEGWDSSIRYNLIGGPFDGDTICRNKVVYGIMPEVVELTWMDKAVAYYLCEQRKRYYYEGLV
mgnify:FL=1|jgi:hypothetical protein|tara:strand:+ start:813 stop:1082 length:270 start_codon:yes stop_codon:yes gene_type:complete